MDGIKIAEEVARQAAEEIKKLRRIGLKFNGKRKEGGLNAL